MSKKKSIFITGAASGIGRAVAVYFAERDWFVGIADINEAGMAETQSMLPAGESSLHTLNVTDRKAWGQALEAFSAAAGGRVDVVFNNAGIVNDGPIAEQPVAQIKALIAVNLEGVIYGAQAAYPHLKRTAPGSALVNTASLAGIISPPNVSVYCATKWGVRGFTHSLDAEWAEDGIKVCALSPGFIDTPIIDYAGVDSNQTLKEQLVDAGVEVNPVSSVPKVVWNAVHGDKLDYTVGKMASRLFFLQRFLPGRLRKEMRHQGVGVQVTS